MTDWNITLTNEKNQTALIDCDDFIRDIVEKHLQAILETEITEHLGAERHERTDERKGYRNGYKPRVLNLSVGSVYLRIPQTREGDFHTELFARYQRSERAFTLAIIQMWLKGVSTRNVAAITEELSSVRFSKSAVSELCKELDGHINAWRSRDLSAQSYPYLFVDALYENINVGGAVVSQGVLIACGVRQDGHREVLDVAVADTESAAAYNALFSSLKERGVSGVKLVVSDAHSGLKAAIARYFQGASWQRCQFHFSKNITSTVSRKDREKVAGDISSVFAQPSKEQALSMAAEVAKKWRSKKGAALQKAADMIEFDIEQSLNILAFPEEHRTRLRTNNMMERLNAEIRRRDRSIVTFPNEESALRLIAALCIEKSEEWASARPWMDMGLLY